MNWYKIEGIDATGRRITKRIFANTEAQALEGFSHGWEKYFAINISLTEPQHCDDLPDMICRKKTMPYINIEMQDRYCGIMSRLEGTTVATQVDDLIEAIVDNFDEEEFEGVCNYSISRIVAGVMKPKTGWRYKWLNRAYGTFLSAGAEFCRRVVGPYEDKCIEKNGDIPEYEQ